MEVLHVPFRQEHKAKFQLRTDTSHLNKAGSGKISTDTQLRSLLEMLLDNSLLLTKQSRRLTAEIMRYGFFCEVFFSHSLRITKSHLTCRDSNNSGG
jgi:hypothetical protein